MGLGSIETRSRLIESSARELENLLEGLFDNPVRIPGTGMAEAPVIGTRYIVSLPHDVLLPAICAALCARERFRRDAPGWPALPLREDDIESLKNDDDITRNVVGMFADSQRGESWRPDHPGFAPFVGGLMFDRHTPRHLRNDPELRREFPARKLAGMCNGWLTWRAPETLALDRKMRKMIRAHEARQAAGLIA